MRAFGFLALAVALQMPVGLISASSVSASEPPVVKAILDGFDHLFLRRPTYSRLDIAPDGSIHVVGLAADGGGAGRPVLAEQLTLSGVRAGIDRFDVAEMTFRGVTLSFPRASIVIPQFVLRDVVARPLLAMSDEVDMARAALLPAKEYTIPEVLILYGGESATIEGLRWSWKEGEAGGSGIHVFDIGRVSAPGAMFREIGDNPLARLGYGSVELSLKGRWTVSALDDDPDHEITIAVEGKDIGVFDARVAVEGVRTSLPYRLLFNLATHDSILSELGSARFKRLDVRYEDRSFATRFLNALAADRNAPVATLLDEAASQMRRDLQPLASPAFTEHAVETFRAFTAAPKSLSATLLPPAPVPGAVLMDAANVPSVLFYVLGPRIEANR